MVISKSMEDIHKNEDFRFNLFMLKEEVKEAIKINVCTLIRYDSDT
jgi:hypothetical protein